MYLIRAVKCKKIITVVMLAVITCCLALVVYLPDIPGYASGRKLPIYGVDSEESVVALTFDAAWGADKTSKIMDMLEEYGVKGTFFLVGFWVDNYPDKVKEIHDRGHLIGNHSTNHPHLNSMNVNQIIEEMNITSEKINQITGIKPTYFRAPFGEYNNTVIESAESQNMQVIQWTVDTLDWKGLSGGQIADRVLSKASKGSIILAHNNSNHILDALPIILQGLENKGLKAVRLDELVLKNDYIIDSNGIQSKNCV